MTNKTHSFQNSGVTETSLSDFHRMTVAVTKMTFQKSQRIIKYRDYNFFDNERFRNDLLQEIPNYFIEFNDSILNFDMCRITLDQHAPRKRKYARGNHMPFVNKTLSKVIMLRNKFCKNRTEENRNRYALQRNYYVSPITKTKKEYFGNLNEKNVCDNKTFWEIVKFFLSDEIISKEQIVLVENNKIISEDIDGAETLNSFFSNIVINFKIPAYVDSNCNVENVGDPIAK